MDLSWQRNLLRHHIMILFIFPYVRRPVVIRNSRLKSYMPIRVISGNLIAPSSVWIRSKTGLWGRIQPRPNLPNMKKNEIKRYPKKGTSLSSILVLVIYIKELIGTVYQSLQECHGCNALVRSREGWRYMSDGWNRQSARRARRK